MEVRERHRIHSIVAGGEGKMVALKPFLRQSYKGTRVREEEHQSLKLTAIGLLAYKYGFVNEAVKHLNAAAALAGDLAYKKNVLTCADLESAASAADRIEKVTHYLVIRAFRRELRELDGQVFAGQKKL